MYSDKTHPARVQDHDFVIVHDGIQPMRDGEDGAVVEGGADGLLDQVVSGVVHGGGRLVLCVHKLDACECCEYCNVHHTHTKKALGSATHTHAASTLRHCKCLLNFNNAMLPNPKTHHHQDLGLPQHRTRHAEQLTLPQGEVRTIVHHTCP